MQSYQIAIRGRYSLLYLTWLALLVFSCESTSNSSAGMSDPFYNQIENIFDEMSLQSIGYLNQPVGTASNQIVVESKHNYIITSNRVDNTIHLYSNRGDSLLSKVGGKGRGPGEFLNISQIHVGYDQKLYVFDVSLMRISTFQIQDNSLVYKEIFTVAPENMKLRDIYVTEHGNFGVFHKIDNYQTKEESFHLYSLDRDFSPVKNLVEIPGNQKLKLREYFYDNHYLGRLTYWDVDAEWFYYITSKSTSISKYNLKNGRRETRKLFDLSDRAKTEKINDLLKKRYDALIESFPTVEDAFDETDELPMFDNLQVKKGRILLDVFYAGGQGGRLIYINPSAEKVRYIKTSTDFWRMALEDSLLYGIETEPETGIRVHIMKLESN